MMFVKYKLIDTSRLNTIVATADPDLQFTLDADSTYLVRGQMWARGGTTGDFKHGFSVGGATLLYAAGASVTWTSAQPDSTKSAGGDEQMGAWNTASVAAGTTRGISMTTGNYRAPIKFSLLMKIGSTGGTFAVIWSQRTVDLTNPAKLIAGSMLSYEKLP
jgi:hypothetical protein